MTPETYHGIRTVLAQIIKGTVWENHVYLVGGCVRDEMMGEKIHDIDIAVDVVNGGIRFVQWLKSRNLVARGRSVQIFEHFGTAKVRLRQYPKEVIDCVQTRKDKYVYEEEPHPEQNFGTIEEDAMRRDLTINSLFVNVSTGELLDPTGLGMQDIQNHVIRTPNDPDETFTDNPMHVLRCIRFAVRYGWRIDSGLLDKLKSNVGILAEATPTRITKEVMSILKLKRKKRAFRLIEVIGATKYVDPVVKLIQQGGVKSDKPHHKRYDKSRKKNNRREKEKGTAIS